MMDTVREFSPDLLALSASLPFHRSRMKDFVEMIKEEYPGTHVMIGGRAVKNGKEDLKYFGADSYGSSAREAVVLAKGLI
jgi:methanogenic corrinoid protein MtbC1